VNEIIQKANDPATRRRLAEGLGASAFTAIASHELLARHGTALYLGNPDHPRALMVFPYNAEDEPVAFGQDPEAIWRLARTADGWGCLNVPAAMASPVQSLMARDLGTSIRLYRDLYFALETPVHLHAHPAVRLLTPQDAALLAEADEPLSAPGVTAQERDNLLAQGLIAGAIIEGKLVALAYATAWATGYVDVGVYTATDHCNRGLATACAALVCRQIQQQGWVPVWSTGEDNWASQHIASKLGYRPVGHRTYLIPQRD